MSKTWIVVGHFGGGIPSSIHHHICQPTGGLVVRRLGKLLKVADVKEVGLVLSKFSASPNIGEILKVYNTQKGSPKNWFIILPSIWMIDVYGKRPHN